ncbi:hypothetical protein QBC46DRAFT_376076 [Diplogelasinospora grovesii]|uniref:Uncharacterized protein n=1 Tax=Diplogelasinospora grovesii TaxID=303347 RepID=A0AAN6S7J8_9PEZI|nr:hypothetical protein QBC46DRAFT_376076 [Diplogelasinospora grovesii]
MYASVVGGDGTSTSGSSISCPGDMQDGHITALPVTLDAQSAISKREKLSPTLSTIQERDFPHSQSSLQWTTPSIVLRARATNSLGDRATVCIPCFGGTFLGRKLNLEVAPYYTLGRSARPSTASSFVPSPRGATLAVRVAGEIAHWLCSLQAHPQMRLAVHVPSELGRIYCLVGDLQRSLDAMSGIPAESPFTYHTSSRTLARHLEHPESDPHSLGSSRGHLSDIQQWTNSASETPMPLLAGGLATPTAGASPERSRSSKRPARYSPDSDVPAKRQRATPQGSSSPTVPLEGFLSPVLPYANKQRGEAPPACKHSGRLGFSSGRLVASTVLSNHASMQQSQAALMDLNLHSHHPRHQLGCSSGVKPDNMPPRRTAIQSNASAMHDPFPFNAGDRKRDLAIASLINPPSPGGRSQKSRTQHAEDPRDARTLTSGQVSAADPFASVKARTLLHRRYAMDRLRMPARASSILESGGDTEPGKSPRISPAGAASHNWPCTSTKPLSVPDGEDPRNETAPAKVLQVAESTNGIIGPWGHYRRCNSPVSYDLVAPVAARDLFEINALGIYLPEQN